MNPVPGLEETIARLEAYCRTRQWAGYDPYDALTSGLLVRTPLARSRIARIALIQFLKRSPVNLRPLLGIRAQQNPKALALFLRYYLGQARAGDEGARANAAHLAARLLELRSPGLPYSCWGYSFPWQTRRDLVPSFAPNLVCTTFVATALLDAYEAGLGTECLTAATSAGHYILQELYWHDEDRAGFAYPLPGVRVPIHNANFLGAALLCRLARTTADAAAVQAALRVTRYSASVQRSDGSWAYGLGPTQQWVDNFHTGYNLCALWSIGRDLATEEFDDALRRGYRFYVSHFFTRRGAPKYFHDRTYPIDIHCAAQSLMTLMALRHLDPRSEELARTVLDWTMTHMWDRRGFFYYRVLRALTIRTPYMRWSQAWMLLALGGLHQHARAVAS
jgi:hypothetical protein